MNAALTQSDQKLPPSSIEIKETPYDRFSAWLVSSCIVIGFLVFVLFLVWLGIAGNFGAVPEHTNLIPLPENEYQADSSTDDWHDPGVKEFPEIRQPQLNDTLLAITEVASTVEADIEARKGQFELVGLGQGRGDDRQRGPDPGPSEISEPKRWKIELAARSAAEYMKVLHKLGVEVAAVSQSSDQIHYITDLIVEEPQIRIGQRKDEQRLYFVNQKNRLRRWESNKLASAGVELRGKIIVQFYSESLRAALRALELEACLEKENDISHVRQTVFRIRPHEDGYEFYVYKITFENARH